MRFLGRVKGFGGVRVSWPRSGSDLATASLFVGCSGLCQALLVVFPVTPIWIRGCSFLLV
ncbi:unnamed protein product [Arabidopsis halleri]